MLTIEPACEIHPCLLMTGDIFEPSQLLKSPSLFSLWEIPPLFQLPRLFGSPDYMSLPDQILASKGFGLHRKNVLPIELETFNG